MLKVRRQIRAAITQMSSLGRVGVQAFTQLGSVMGSTVGQAFTDLIRNAVGLRNQIGTVKEAFKSLGRAALRVLQQVIAKLASAAAISAILGPILGVSSAGFGAIFSSLIGGGQIPGVAAGGRVEESGIARVHKGEQIVNAETVGMMQDFMASVQSFTQPVMPNAQSAIASATGGQLKVQNDVQITGELRGRGPDLVASFRQALSEEATVGGPGSL